MDKLMPFLKLGASLTIRGDDRSSKRAFWLVIVS
jgi:hypothetical protein